MGGAIAAALVCAFPALVERDVVLLASAGVLEVRTSECIVFEKELILEQLPPPPSHIASISASVKALIFVRIFSFLF
jgi:hypothetical protein